VILLVHAAATLFMTGLIWFVQLVHYPLFARVEARVFPGYEIEHMRRTARIVTPAMLVEAAAAIALLFDPRAPAAAAWAGAVLLATVWLSTAFLQAPRHVALRRAFEAPVHARLVATNWIRTAAWSARSVLALAMVASS
jgi:hypothetical protein